MTHVIENRDGHAREQQRRDFAGHQRLERLIVLFDDNHITIDGALDLSSSTDQLERFDASGWNTMRCDGHDPDAIADALTQAVRGSTTEHLVVHWVHRSHVVALLLQVRGNLMCVLLRRVRRANDRDRPGAAQDRAQHLVVIVVSGDSFAFLDRRGGGCVTPRLA